MITSHTKYLPATEPSLPALALQIIELVDSYMLWIGVAEGGPEEIQQAPSRGHLCKDWACAMPSRDPSMPALATPLFRSASPDVALYMAQRMAKRFHKQIFLSVDIPTGFLTVGHGAQLLLEAEKGIVSALKDLEVLRMAETENKLLIDRQ